MDAFLNAVKGVAFLGQASEGIVVDSAAFALFNKVTSPLFIAFSVIVSTRQFFGEPIVCDAGTSGVF